jgi:hypothetical protein
MTSYRRVGELGLRNSKQLGTHRELVLLVLIPPRAHTFGHDATIVDRATAST